MLELLFLLILGILMLFKPELPGTNRTFNCSR